eukprot:6188010-Pleurochrysis_carterae.AAC.6
MCKILYIWRDAGAAVRPRSGASKRVFINKAYCDTILRQLALERIQFGIDKSVGACSVMRCGRHPSTHLGLAIVRDRAEVILPVTIS